MTCRRDQRGQILPIIATVLAAAALAGAGIAALVASSESKRSKALEAKQAFLPPNVYVNGLARSGPERECAMAVLSRHGLTLQNGEWRTNEVPVPTSSGDAAQDRANLKRWQAQMHAHIATFQDEIDGCNPAATSSTTSKSASALSDWYDVTFDVLSEGCQLLEDRIYVKRTGAKVEVKYNYVGAARNFAGAVDADERFDLEFSQTRNIGEDRPLQNFVGRLRGQFDASEDGASIIRDGIFDGTINGDRCTAEFDAEPRG